MVRVVLLCLLGLVSLGATFVPLGFVVWLPFAAIALAAPDPELMRPEDSGFKLAGWGRKHRGLLFGKLQDVWRFGPAKMPKDKSEPSGIRPEPGRLRPVRLSALAALGAGVSVMMLDLALSSAAGSLTLPVDDWPPVVDPTARPWWTPILGIWFVWTLVTALASTARTILIEEEHPCDAPPAVVPDNGGLVYLARQFVAWPVLPVPLLMLGFSAAEFLRPTVTPHTGWVWPLLMLAVGGVTFAGPWALKGEVKAQRADWRYRQEQIFKWQSRWQSIPRFKNLDVRQLPSYTKEFPLPKKLEGKPCEPTYMSVAFGLHAGYELGDYETVAEKLSPALGQKVVLIEPYKMPTKNGENPEGTVSWKVFTVSYPLKQFGSLPHLDPQLDATTSDFFARYAVITAFSDLKLGRPIRIKVKRLTVPTSRSSIWLSEWKLTKGVTAPQVADKTEQLAEKLGCRWVRVYSDQESEWMKLYFGGHPMHADFVHHEEKVKVNRADWAYYMASAGMKGSGDRTPQLLDVTDSPGGLDEMHFLLPVGLGYSEVDAAQVVERLRSASGYAYIQPRPKPKYAGQFSLLVGEKDPLDNVFLFSDYTSDILRTPQRGELEPGWCVGIGSDAKPVWYEWEGEEPHLLVAGSSGSGKSGIINSCLVQMLHNNHPEDLEMWMLEPKNELQAYQHLAHVKRFVDGNITECNLYESASLLLREALEEMRFRYRMFSQHPETPQKLAEARQLAADDPENSGHLNFPRLFVVIEECSTIFTKPPPGDKEQKLAWEDLNSSISELARLSRAAGIHMVVATQYPTNQNIPQILKQQCLRLGLQTADNLASQVIIDQPGLENIKQKGRGKVSGDGGYVDFRGLLMDRPDTNRPDIADDRRNLMISLPTDNYWPKLPPEVDPMPEQVERMITLPNGEKVKAVQQPPRQRTYPPVPTSQRRSSVPSVGVDMGRPPRSAGERRPSRRSPEHEGLLSSPVPPWLVHAERAHEEMPMVATDVVPDQGAQPPPLPASLRPSPRPAPDLEGPPLPPLSAPPPLSHPPSDGLSVHADASNSIPDDPTPLSIPVPPPPVSDEENSEGLSERLFGPQPVSE